MKIEKSIKFHNARQREKNEKNGKPLNYNLINKAKIGRLIWKDQKGKRPLTSMSSLVNGRSKMVREEWINLICLKCKVDPNFLFGVESKHDQEFNRLNEECW